VAGSGVKIQLEFFRRALGYTTDQASDLLVTRSLTALDHKPSSDLLVWVQHGDRAAWT